jgi:hemerythrin-like metal-binding protein
MLPIQWNVDYKQYHQEIIDQHYQFSMILNELYETIRLQEGEMKAVFIISELERCARTHFSYEEELLLEESSSRLSEYKREQSQFMQKIQKLKTCLSSRNVSQEIELVSCLRGWFKDHIQAVDSVPMPI